MCDEDPVTDLGEQIIALVQKHLSDTHAETEDYLRGQLENARQIERDLRARVTRLQGENGLLHGILNEKRTPADWASLFGYVIFPKEGSIPPEPMNLAEFQQQYVNIPNQPQTHIRPPPS
jgi:hypothetical protein